MMLLDHRYEDAIVGEVALVQRDAGLLPWHPLELGHATEKCEFFWLRACVPHPPLADRDFGTWSLLRVFGPAAFERYRAAFPMVLPQGEVRY